MTLELLAGPFTLHEPDDSPAGSYGPGTTWDDALGLMGTLVFSDRYMVSQMDGLVYQRGNAVVGRFILDAVTGGWAARELSLPTDVYAVDLPSGVQSTTSLGNAAYTVILPLIVRATDRWLSAVRDSGLGYVVVKSRAPDLSGEWVNECSIQGITTSEFAMVSRGTGRDVVCFTYPSGEVFFYDLDKREQVGPVKWLPSNNGAWYSGRHDVFVVLTAADEVSIYANSVRPDDVSDPVALSPLAVGRVTQVRVRVTGSHGEPCPDELVEWSITAGDGEIADTQSTTDADGYAVARYVAPLTLGVDPTIEASVVF